MILLNTNSEEENNLSKIINFLENKIKKPFIRDNYILFSAFPVYLLILIFCHSFKSASDFLFFVFAVLFGFLMILTTILVIECSKKIIDKQKTDDEENIVLIVVISFLIMVIISFLLNLIRHHLANFLIQKEIIEGYWEFQSYFDPESYPASLLIAIITICFYILNFFFKDFFK